MNEDARTSTIVYTRRDVGRKDRLIGYHKNMIIWALTTLKMFCYCGVDISALHYRGKQPNASLVDQVLAF